MKDSLNIFSFSGYYYNFLLNENRDKRAESRSYKNFILKYKDVPDAMYSFRDYVSNNKTEKLNPLVGINPKTAYSTPIGIYGYPLKETISKLEKNSLEFASDRPIVVVYKPKAGIPVARTSTFSRKDLNEKLEKLTTIFQNSPFYEKYNSPTEINYTLCEIWETFIQAEIKPNYRKNPLQTLWSIVRILCDENIHKWAKIMINLGIPIIIDDIESGTIHYNEPTQCVVFGKRFVDIIGVWEKPTDESSEKIKARWKSLIRNLELSKNDKDFNYWSLQILQFFKHSQNFTITEISKMIYKLQSIISNFSENQIETFQKMIETLLDRNYSYHEKEQLLDVIRQTAAFYIDPTDYAWSFVKFCADYLFKKAEIKDIENLWTFLLKNDFNDFDKFRENFKYHPDDIVSGETYFILKIKALLKDKDILEKIREKTLSFLILNYSHRTNYNLEKLILFYFRILGIKSAKETLHLTKAIRYSRSYKGRELLRVFLTIPKNEKMKNETLALAKEDDDSTLLKFLENILVQEET